MPVQWGGVRVDCTVPVRCACAQRGTHPTFQVEQAVTVNSAPYLGKMIVDELGMIQCLRVQYLLPASELADLLPQQEG